MANHKLIRRNKPGSSYQVTIAGVQRTFDVATGNLSDDEAEVRRASGAGDGDCVERIGDLRAAEADELGLEPGKAKQRRDTLG